MKFIKLLQQGGYILPQYAGGQQTYQVPQIGMQVLSSMLQSDQQTFQQKATLDQLNMQQAQLRNSIFSQGIKNSILLREQENKDKAYELANKKLEYEMVKTALNDMEAADDWVGKNFLPQDQQSLNDEILKKGWDANTVMKDFASTKNWENLMAASASSSAYKKTYKQGLQNKYIANIAETRRKGLETIMTKMQDNLANGIATHDDVIASLGEFNTLMQKMIRFNNDPNSIESQQLLQSPEWESIVGRGTAINMAKMKKVLDQKERFDETKWKSDEAKIKLTEAQTTASLAEMDLKNKAYQLQYIKDNLALIPYNNLLEKYFGENASEKLFNNWSDYYNKLTPDQKVQFKEELEELYRQNALNGIGGSKGMTDAQYKDKTLQDLQTALYNQYIAAGMPIEEAKNKAFIDAYTMSKTNFVNGSTNRTSYVHLDKSGNPVPFSDKTEGRGGYHTTGKDGKGDKIYDKGFTTTADGVLKSIDFPIIKFSPKSSAKEKYIKQWPSKLIVDKNGFTTIKIDNKDYRFKVEMYTDDMGEEYPVLYIPESDANTALLHKLKPDNVTLEDLNILTDAPLGLPNFDDFSLDGDYLPMYIKNMFTDASTYEKENNRYRIALTPNKDNTSIYVPEKEDATPSPTPSTPSPTNSLPAGASQDGINAIEDILNK